MAKKAKESIPLSVRMDKSTHERLVAFCEDSGQSKTVAIERAVNMYISDYDAKMKKLNNNETKNP